MIIITGAGGFIGSCLVSTLNQQGYTDLILVDDFSQEEKRTLIKKKAYSKLIEIDELDTFMKENHRLIQYIFHLGAITDTTEFDYKKLYASNVAFSQMIWNNCVEFGLPMLFASSAATYGLGEFSFSDDLNPDQLSPLNPYGVSKNEFDKWALSQENKPFQWVGLKFFNVYGPNEFNKGRMASVVYSAFNQIITNGSVTLFKSHKEDVEDGDQSRDFIYVKDVVSICLHFMVNRLHSGIYNVSTGNARTFNDLVNTVFETMQKTIIINWIDTPLDIRDKYQYFTEGPNAKLLNAGYKNTFYSLETGIKEYIEKYLIGGNIF